MAIPHNPRCVIRLEVSLFINVTDDNLKNAVTEQTWRHPHWWNHEHGRLCRRCNMMQEISQACPVRGTCRCYLPSPNTVSLKRMSWASAARQSMNQQRRNNHYPQRIQKKYEDHYHVCIPMLQLKLQLFQSSIQDRFLPDKAIDSRWKVLRWTWPLNFRSCADYQFDWGWNLKSSYTRRRFEKAAYFRIQGKEM